MTINLPEDIESSIRAQVQDGHFASVDDAMVAAARLLIRSQDHSNNGSTPSSTLKGKLDLGPDLMETALDASAEAEPPKPIWEVFEEIAATIPDEEWAKLPTDGSEQHDHYIYGTAKHPTS